MPYVPRNLRVEFYCKVCKSLSQGSFSFVPLWTIPFMSELKGMYAILVIRLKQSKSLHLIQQDGGCVNTLPILEYIYALLLETWKIPLKASWCFQTLNFQKTFALRICLWKIKVWDTLSSLIFFQEEGWFLAVSQRGVTLA